MKLKRIVRYFGAVFIQGFSDSNLRQGDGLLQPECLHFRFFHTLTAYTTGMIRWPRVKWQKIYQSAKTKHINVFILRPTLGTYNNYTALCNAYTSLLWSVRRWVSFETKNREWAKSPGDGASPIHFNIVPSEAHFRRSFTSLVSNWILKQKCLVIWAGENIGKFIIFRSV